MQFKIGLNVILGDDNATNSIGKSTLLMVIDFCFGGSDLLSHNTDLIPELGHHDYSFAFRFEEQDHRFRRGTFEPSLVYICDETYSPGPPISLQEYTAFLKQAYKISLPDLSFRALVGLYIRVWGKDNLSVERPLNLDQRQAAGQCVDILLKTFDRYSAIRDVTQQLSAAEGQIEALRQARKYDFVPKISKRAYEENDKRINELEREMADIRLNLARYATNLSEVVNKEVLQLKLQKDQLLAQRLSLASRLQRVQGNLNGSRVIRSESFRDLINFFPEISKDRLEKVEDFHRDVARLLRTELQESEAQLDLEISRIDGAIAEIDIGMSQTLSSVEQPNALVEHVYRVSVELDNTRGVNQIFDDESALKTRLGELQEQLALEKKNVLQIVEDTVNDGMRRVVTSVFGGERKSPELTLQEKSYKFKVYDDTGTGVAYSSLVVLDLTVFQATVLPVVVHDTLLFKNIENDSVSRLIQIYLNSNKQSFIALDEIDKYGSETASILRSRSAIALDNVDVLYVKDWRPSRGSQKLVKE
ncbi:hypothetical protein GRAN_1277 [Granulicella sibirica]|uniref:DUF2326 domain-containing protein n=1 Tax=Granulicella sibirica TaxID=2479048 RepID=A0A4Q0T3U2_9BACT|nr:hypothetical protein GRAN_1277 [Granulicella sibirica]